MPDESRSTYRLKKYFDFECKKREMIATYSVRRFFLAPFLPFLPHSSPPREREERIAARMSQTVARRRAKRSEGNTKVIKRNCNEIKTSALLNVLGISLARGFPSPPSLASRLRFLCATISLVQRKVFLFHDFFRIMIFI